MQCLSLTLYLLLLLEWYIYLFVSMVLCLESSLMSYAQSRSQMMILQHMVTQDDCMLVRMPHTFATHTDGLLRQCFVTRFTAEDAV